jgi:hypothetical protein
MGYVVLNILSALVYLLVAGVPLIILIGLAGALLVGAIKGVRMDSDYNEGRGDTED